MLGHHPHGHCILEGMEFLVGTELMSSQRHLSCGNVGVLRPLLVAPCEQVQYFPITPKGLENIHHNIVNSAQFCHNPQLVQLLCQLLEGGRRRKNSLRLGLDAIL